MTYYILKSTGISAIMSQEQMSNRHRAEEGVES